jgi:hypothetical protein
MEWIDEHAASIVAMTMLIDAVFLAVWFSITIADSRETERRCNRAGGMMVDRLGCVKHPLQYIDVEIVE